MSSPQTLGQLVDDYMFRHANLDAPAWYVNPDFKFVLDSEAGRNLSAATTLNFVPGLLEVLQSDTPSSPDFFATTPQPRTRSGAKRFEVLHHSPREHIQAQVPPGPPLHNVASLRSTRLCKSRLPRANPVSRSRKTCLHTRFFRVCQISTSSGEHSGDSESLRVEQLIFAVGQHLCGSQRRLSLE